LAPFENYRRKPSADAIRSELDRAALTNLVRRERATVHREAIQDLLNAAHRDLDETHQADEAHKPRRARRWADLERAIAGTYNTSANAPLPMMSWRWSAEDMALRRSPTRNVVSLEPEQRSRTASAIRD
jgi:phytoene dehydrogenase-like protein